MTKAEKALRRLAEITAELEPLESRRAALREEASRLVVAALKDNAPPTDVAERSPFSPAHVRTLARMAGLPPARRSGPSGRSGDR